MALITLCLEKLWISLETEQGFAPCKECDKYLLHSNLSELSATSESYLLSFVTDLLVSLQHTQSENYIFISRRNHK